MLRLALRGVRFNLGRYVATLVAIITGVAFFAASGFLAQRVIDALEGSAEDQFGAVDAAVVPDDTDDDNAGFAQDLRVDGSSFDAIAEADGVEGVAGILTGTVAFQDADGEATAGTTGRLWVDDEELNPLDVVEGAAPSGGSEIVVDEGLAEDEGLAVGDGVTILTLAGPFDATVVGITSFGSADSIDSGGTVSMTEDVAFDWLASGLREYEAVYVRGTGDLVAAIEPAVPEGFLAQTGDEFIEDQKELTAGFGKVLKQGLQFFSLLAVFVGSFVIYNTFTVIVAQRQRELAVLAAIGATPKQLKRSMRFEGVVIGLLGGVLGVVAGFGLALGLGALLAAFGVSLPGSGITFVPSTVVQGILIGVVITYFAVRAPARKAARVEPVEAMRDAAVETTQFSRQRTIVTFGLLAYGVLQVLFGSSGAAVGMGSLAAFIGIVLAGPYIAVVAAKVLAPIMGRFGLEARLAVDNTARNPKRTATTANALLIGVFLVTLVTVAGTSAKDFAVREINELSSADYFLSSDGGTIDDGLVADLQAVPDVTTVVPFRTETVTIAGEPGRMSTGDLEQLTTVADLDVDEGSLDDLAEGTIALIGDAGYDAELGDTVTVADAAGDTVDLEVVALLKGSIDSASVGSLVSTETFDDLVGDTAPTVAFIDVVSGAETDTEDAIDEITSLRPDITVSQGNALGQLIGTIFDFLINAVNGLLGMSVLVALIGIVNTLSLSILERRRELGLLRIVGMTDNRVQRMVGIESVLIALMGTVSGLLIGTFIGFGLISAIDRLSDADVPFSFAPVRLLVVLVLGVVLGAAAAFIPAKRSTRLSELDAIQAT